MPPPAYPWANAAPSSRLSPDMSDRPQHQRSESEVIAASALRQPSTIHRSNASTPPSQHSPSGLRSRPSPRKDKGTHVLTKPKSSPNLSVPSSARDSTVRHVSHSSGAERIIKGTSRWLRDKLDMGGAEKKDDGWLILDLHSPSVVSESTNSRAVPAYDQRGYPTRQASFETARPVAGPPTPHSPTGPLISDPEIRNYLSDSHNGRHPQGSLGYSHKASLSPLAAHFPVGLSALDTSAESDFFPGGHSNLSFGSGPRLAPSIYESSMRSHASLSSFQDSDTDSVAQLREDDPFTRVMALGAGINGEKERRKRNGLQSMYTLKSLRLRPNQKKRENSKLFDLLPFHIDPSQWHDMDPEEDDSLHHPDAMDKHDTAYFTKRGLANLGCLLFLLLAVVMIFAGYPVLTYYYPPHHMDNNVGYNLGGINATGQVPSITNFFQLIDPDTPPEAYTHMSAETGEEWELVFSDEFNQEGRTFNPGDDPFWEAVDLHYWQTNNLEWYDPKRLTTKDGKLVITLDKIVSHGMNFEGAMMSSWNQFCFSGGYIEGTSILFLAPKLALTLWPAIWTMGNLGRAGYGGTLDGTWPYSYDTCDVGTLANQTLNGKPETSLTNGDPNNGNELSYLPGQRLSSCTCENDPHHPGPKHEDGTWVGRSAPEIDIFEATIEDRKGKVSQSGQWAPFSSHYYFKNTSDNYYKIYDEDETQVNTYMGSVYQQATSAVTVTKQNCYTNEKGCFESYGFEYEEGSDGYITWINDNKKAWTIRGSAMGPDEEAEVGQRIVSDEPMYIILNLGISENFGAIHYVGLDPLWPISMEVDYVRVYQDPKKRNIGCDPADRPTAAYIAQFPEAYSDPNITVFDNVPGATWPKNRLIDDC
ncbi:glucosidase [Cryptococcus wingfieldii CBS 7118]|uniref:Glucosidase n=1 Tax=Cryptococcus wingfieldii CBS 7118 TaxID=1295528 RepID=A0A1E3JZB5_9TREE|nr:glucosidase [Cryptococcus wingfieldii CBS 7118]ODO06113.1 glucosidase [Cryptococcus wingfieldii CBS 7118]